MCAALFMCILIISNMLACMQILALHVVLLDRDGDIGRRQLHILCDPVTPNICIVHVHCTCNVKQAYNDIVQILPTYLILDRDRDIWRWWFGNLGEVPWWGSHHRTVDLFFYLHFCAVQSRGCRLTKLGEQIENTVCSIFIIFYSRSEGEEVVGLVGARADKWELLDPSFLLSGYFHL